MSGKSVFLENALLAHSMGQTAYTMPATIALALLTAVPGPGDTGATVSEISYVNYNRLVINPATDLGTPSGGHMLNALALAWNTSSGGGGTVQAVGVLDSATVGAGNLLRWGLATFSVATLVTPRIAAGQLDISEG